MASSKQIDQDEGESIVNSWELKRWTGKGMSALGGVLLAWLLVAGCSGSAEDRSAVVSGKVTLDGAPVSAGTVLFMTEDGHAATAELDPDGAYTVRVRPDRFKVAVTPPDAPDPDAQEDELPKAVPGARPIPSRYRELGQSGLSVEVMIGENTYDIALTR